MFKDAKAIEENLKYKDLIIKNFIDSYYNLTITSLILLKWVEYNCKYIRYVVKVDDDVYLT